MIPTRQTIYGTSFTYQKGNCLQCCIASILNLPLNKVPHFVQLYNNNWGLKMIEFCKLNGFVVTGTYIPSYTKNHNIVVGRYYKDLRCYVHCVIGYGKNQIFDPQIGYLKRNVLTDIKYYINFYKKEN
jgi:hypothetical protein